MKVSKNQNHENIQRIECIKCIPKSYCIVQWSVNKLLTYGRMNSLFLLLALFYILRKDYAI